MLVKAVNNQTNNHSKIFLSISNIRCTINFPFQRTSRDVIITLKNNKSVH